MGRYKDNIYFDEFLALPVQPRFDRPDLRALEYIIIIYINHLLFVQCTLCLYNNPLLFVHCAYWFMGVVLQQILDETLNNNSISS